MRLYVGNLSFHTSEADLNALFSQVGTVESCSIITDRDTGRSRGFGFVEMSSKAEGEAAIARFSGQEFGGRSLTVNQAEPRGQSEAGSPGPGGGFAAKRRRDW